jgi:hypothetical protein
MKDKLRGKKGRPKKSYVKPEVKQVELRPEEAVLGFCKQTTNFGPGANDCGVGVSPCPTTGT